MRNGGQASERGAGPEIGGGTARNQAGSAEGGGIAPRAAASRLQEGRRHPPGRDPHARHRCDPPPLLDPRRAAVVDGTRGLFRRRRRRRRRRRCRIHGAGPRIVRGRHLRSAAGRRASHLSSAPAARPVRFVYYTALGPARVAGLQPAPRGATTGVEAAAGAVAHTAAGIRAGRPAAGLLHVADRGRGGVALRARAPPPSSGRWDAGAHAASTCRARCAGTRGPAMIAFQLNWMATVMVGSAQGVGLAAFIPGWAGVGEWFGRGPWRRASDRPALSFGIRKRGERREREREERLRQRKNA